MRASPEGFCHGHRREDAKLASLIGGRRNNSTPRGPTNQYRLAAKLRLVALLHRCKKRIKVDVEYLTSRHRQRVRYHADAAVIVCIALPVPSLKIFFHNHCFDGATSAALFADFYRSTQKADATIEFCGMSHGPTDPFDAVAIDGEVNACVDFRYCKDERMLWWFDHHASAFQPPSLETHFASSRGKTKFYDPAARSCALFMATTLREEFGYTPGDSAGL